MIGWNSWESEHEHTYWHCSNSTSPSFQGPGSQTWLDSKLSSSSTPTGRLLRWNKNATRQTLTWRTPISDPGRIWEEDSKRMGTREAPPFGRILKKCSLTNVGIPKFLKVNTFVFSPWLFLGQINKPHNTKKKKQSRFKELKLNRASRSRFCQYHVCGWH